MTAQIIDGTSIAKKLQKEIALAIEERTNRGLRAPKLAVIMVGTHPAAKIYTDKKKKMCEALGILSKTYNLPKDVSEKVLLSLIESLNLDDSCDGILVQLPLPKHIHTNKVLEHIRPDKDVDGFHPYNLGRLAIGQPFLQACTPKGIMTLLKHTKIDLKGLHGVIIGASNIVGKPMMLELILVHCTVTICRSTTKDLSALVKQADLIVAAAGVPHLVKGDWIKKGAIVIDVGINRLPDGKVVGDVDFEVAKEYASWITPVPGGVGPMTVVTLMNNTLFAANALHKNR